MSTQGHDVDILVAGGGIVGAVAALAFCRSGFTTALLDDRDPGLPGHEYRRRVSSINLASESILVKLGAWQELKTGRLSPVERIEVWDCDGADLSFDAADAGLNHLAHILENDLVAGAARHVLESNPEFHALPPARVAAIRHSTQAVEVLIDGGEVVRCRLLVAADGAHSTIRRLSGIQRRVFDYRQQAVVARVFPERPHEHVARQKFLPTGPLAFLPLADESCSIVWSLDDAAAAQVLALDDDAFGERLERDFDARLGRILGVQTRSAFPLKRSHASRYVAERTALVGDACHTVHPLAGLGANQGIADAAALVDAVARARDAGRQFWLPRVLSRYERSRRSDNTAILAAMDLFHLGFANDLPMLSAVRGRLLSLVDRSPAAKRFFINRAAGTAP